MDALKFVDLSWPIKATTPIYPGDPVPKIEVFTTIQSIGYNLFSVYIGSQTGTHVDAPFHFLNSGDTIDRMELDFFFGEGLIIDVIGRSAFSKIKMYDILKYDQKIRQGGIILFRTDWHYKHGTEDYERHPYLDIEVAEYLVSKQVKTVGVDTLNLDKTGGTEFPVHELFARERVMVAENLRNLDKVDFQNPLIAAFPLNLEGCDGAPIRAVAIQLSHI